MGLVLAAAACDKGEPSPDDSSSPVDTAELGPEVPLELRLGGAMVQTGRDADGGLRLSRTLSWSDPTHRLPTCSTADVAADFALCPDGDCAAPLALPDTTAELRCGGVPADLALVVVPAEDEAAGAAVAAALDEALLDAWAQGARVAVVRADAEGGIALSLSEADAAVSLPDLSSGRPGSLRAALELAMGELDRPDARDNRAVVLITGGAAPLDTFSLPTSGVAPVHVVSGGDWDEAQAFASSGKGVALVDADLVRGAADAVGLVTNAAVLTVASPVRPGFCGALAGRTEVSLGGLQVTTDDALSLACPETMPEPLRGRFWVDPLGRGLGRAPWEYGFGPRCFSDGTFSFHNGLDLEAERGAAVNAVDAGEVIHAGTLEAYPASGRFVIVDHGGGLYTWYLHLEEVLVQEGDRLARGEVLGRAGDSGANHVHLHLAMTWCEDCVDGDRPRYSEATLNPAWLLPRADTADHEVQAVAVNATLGQVGVQVGFPSDELDLQEILLLDADGEVLAGAHVELRDGVGTQPRTGDVTVDPLPGPMDRSAAWSVTFHGLDVRGARQPFEAVAVDLSGHEASLRSR